MILIVLLLTDHDTLIVILGHWRVISEVQNKDILLIILLLSDHDILEIWMVIFRSTP